MAISRREFLPSFRQCAALVTTHNGHTEELVPRRPISRAPAANPQQGGHQINPRRLDGGRAQVGVRSGTDPGHTLTERQWRRVALEWVGILSAMSRGLQLRRRWRGGGGGGSTRYLSPGEVGKVVGASWSCDGIRGDDLGLLRGEGRRSTGRCLTCGSRITVASDARGPLARGPALSATEPTAWCAISSQLGHAMAWRWAGWCFDPTRLN
jgi:hypothetical protein